MTSLRGRSQSFYNVFNFPLFSLNLQFKCKAASVSGRQELFTTVARLGNSLCMCPVLAGNGWGRNPESFKYIRGLEKSRGSRPARRVSNSRTKTRVLLLTPSLNNIRHLDETVSVHALIRWRTPVWQREESWTEFTRHTCSSSQLIQLWHVFPKAQVYLDPQGQGLENSQLGNNWRQKKV